ncbi:MAG: hypothetical protein IT460_16720 [Planctomycetes bacterium]|nr:hypothetical protein [Planctomycetota bacterium]
MRLADSETVDYLSLEKGSGTIVATLVDDFVGTGEIERLALLQKKLNRYFDFIESGEIYQQLTRSTGSQVSRGSRVRISIVAKQELVGEGQRFLRHAEEAAKDANVELAFKVVPA